MGNSPDHMIQNAPDILGKLYKQYVSTSTSGFSHVQTMDHRISCTVEKKQSLKSTGHKVMPNRLWIFSYRRQYIDRVKSLYTFVQPYSSYVR
jgi:hypothetical protein